MGYVRSRKFCCCLPVRFGVFSMATIGVILGAVISIAGWVQIHNTYSGKSEMETDQKVALWFLSFTYTWMTLVSIVGLIGALGRMRGWVKFYAYTVTLNTLVIICVGIYFIWTLFHKRGDDDVDKCLGSTTGEEGKVKHWVCQKGFDALRIVYVVVLCIIWLFQIAGIFVVFDYVGQLREEAETEEETNRRPHPYGY